MISWHLQLFIALTTCAGTMAILWAIQCRTRNATSVDAAWALLIGAAAVFYGLTGSGDHERRILIAVLGGIWGLRLGGHLLIDRVLRETHEDGRYAAMRAHWGADANRQFIWFFSAQAIAAFLFGLPFFALAGDFRPLSLGDAGAIVWWAATLGLVALADRQLAIWRADPAHRGKTCTAGLWQYSRHPNYFFEWCHWFTYPLLAWGGPAQWPVLAAPAVLLLLLLFVSGIPYTEKRALVTRPDYRDYQRRTSAFIPWFPRAADPAKPVEPSPAPRT